MYELSVLFASISAALLTYEIGTVHKKGTVRASAVASLLFGVPFFLAPAAGIMPGAFAQIPAAAMGASFVGMSSMRTIPSRIWIAVSASVFSFIFLFSSPVFAGNGGGLGTNALVAVIIALGTKKVLNIFKKYVK